MTNQLHLESLKEELANAEMINRQLSAYVINSNNLLSEIQTAFLHSNERYSDKVQAFLVQTPKACLAENNLQVVEGLIYGGSVALAQTSVMDAIKAYADKFRIGT